MLSNRVTRNIWLVLSITSAYPVIGRAIGIANGSGEWLMLCSAIIICAACIRFYLYYRRQVKKGILFGKGNPWRDSH
ncbi:hypothetical protein HPS57_03540 [Prevotella sp. PINT]|uniref:hypothetical protein n=1 Tax=Palleniella intestinalis TaxID=2736291 RepID=UPI001551722B|nr:hypothetical protein [Palleniella intestinalis]NPD81049.1 hypothetical protein [Palleniella intestinalis]